MPAWAGRLDAGDHQGARRLRPHAGRRPVSLQLPARTVGVPSGSGPEIRRAKARRDQHGPTSPFEGIRAMASRRQAHSRRRRPSTADRSDDSPAVRGAQGHLPAGGEGPLPDDQVDRSSSSRWASTTSCRSCAGTAAPNAPDQAVLIDLPNRRFYFFFIEIWPQELYYVTGLLVLAALVLFLMNAVAGRVWCGYLCPQTVWTDLFYAVERLIEGDRREQIRKKDSGRLGPGARLREGAQALALADDRLVDRRRLGALLRRRADAGARARHLPGAGRCLCLDRHPHLHDLRARRLHARAGLPLHVPVAAHPGRADGRARAQRHLPLRPRRAAHVGQEGRGGARQGASRPATASTAASASTSARPASTSATARSSAASSAACASTPATT